MVLQEDSKTDETSCDDELSDWQRDNMDYAKQIAASRDQVDKRFIDLYLCRKVAQKGARMGFKSDLFINRKQSLSMGPIDMVHRLEKRRSFEYLVPGPLDQSSNWQPDILQQPA